MMEDLLVIVISSLVAFTALPAPQAALCMILWLPIYFFGCKPHCEKKYPND